jgi:rRNA maturation RNase YbeY
MPKVHFFFTDTKVPLRNRTQLKAFIETIFKQEKTRLESINYVFGSDEYLLDINRQYLNHDYYTDIITFNLADSGTPVMGDVHISYDRIRDNATIVKSSVLQELHRVIFHGALHLCGYKDKSPSDEKLMRKKEDEYLAKYFKKVSRGTL